MSSQRHNCDALIIGGGPAGLAAAHTAAQDGQRVTVVDDNPAPGGQVWRGEHKAGAPEAAEWFRKIADAGVEFIAGAHIFAQPATNLLMAETADGVIELGYRKLILATGARECFLPFPGWTLPNVMGAGGLQALVKSGLPIDGKKVVVAGSGPLLLAVAAYLRKRGADILLIAEQASRGRLLQFGLGLFSDREKAFQAIGLRRQLAGVPYLTGCWPVAAQGIDKLSRITMRRGRKTWTVGCDYLACGFHLLPNVELAALLGCEIEDGGVLVDDYQKTSVADVYCAGEATGIGGLELALIEGRIAGYAATDKQKEAEKLFDARRKARRFASLLNRAFALRDELKALPQPDTIVCRCEDVTFGQLQAYRSWREAKLQARCGMGPCQGRICGAAVEFLFGWQAQSVRPPVFPVRLECLAQATARQEL
ncbi:MAG TPA: FAD/NAD(P)-binding oxidoreductase [Blastocatellia bacterium]|nr:FAD/NAD(P)-binding oxidoreductase [Blastocatellia bacterium]